MLYWEKELYEQFNETISDQKFPCLFAKKSQELKTQEKFFYDENESGALESLKNSLIKYTDYIKHTDIKIRLYTPLLIFVKPQPHIKLESYHRYAWNLIQTIHDFDPEKWPDHIPKDPEHHLWTFCFNKVQLFINISAPLHKFHRSRNLGAGLVLVVNPRENFDYVAGNNPAGERIRDIIRSRCVEYDGVPLSPSIGFYNNANNSEWKQYQISEKGGLSSSKCPVHIKHK